MKKLIILFLSLISVFGCASGGKIMTAEKFSEVSIGMTSQEVEKKFGKPYSIRELSSNEKQYIYIEKLDFGARGVIAERHYLITLKNGRVTSTHTKVFNRPRYERNSYEMQTTYQEDPSGKQVSER